MSIEDEYEDVLQNLEQAIIGYYNQNPTLIDSEVEIAISWLIKFYAAETQGKSSSYPKPRGIALEVIDSVKEMCEWRLGRERLKVEDESGEITEVAAAEMELQKLTPSEIVVCLKKIQSSVKFWTKKPDRQGYLKQGKSVSNPIDKRIVEQSSCSHYSSLHVSFFDAASA